MKHYTDSLKKFNKAFNIKVDGGLIADLGLSKNKLRFDLMKEENEEYLEAANNNDLIEVADALGDMLYVLCGTMLEHGLENKMKDIFDEIQKSNMSKLDDNGKPIVNGENGVMDWRKPEGKILKSENFVEPDFVEILSA